MIFTVAPVGRQFEPWLRLDGGGAVREQSLGLLRWPVSPTATEPCTGTLSRRRRRARLAELGKDRLLRSCHRTDSAVAVTWTQPSG